MKNFEISKMDESNKKPKEIKEKIEISSRRRNIEEERRERKERKERIEEIRSKNEVTYGFTSEQMKVSCYIENNKRYVKPYYYNYIVQVKDRWIGMTLGYLFINEFKYTPEQIVCYQL